MNSRSLLFLFFITFIIPSLSAQIQLEQLEDNQVIKEFLRKYPEKLQQKNTQVCPTISLTLPFFEDFSNNENGVFPTCDKWQDNHAFVNQTMAFNPPSFGTATLDGINADGRPYDTIADPNIASAADTLTSQLIDLSSYNSFDNLIFSFFYQAQGLADRPEINDSLIIEFRDTANNWITIQRFSGISNQVSQLDTLDFNQSFTILDDPAFFHTNFQFRFRNKASICGNNDHWHLDHIYLDENRTDTVAPVYYSDICYTKAPVSAFKKYTAIPWQHFSTDLWNDTLSMRTFNHSNQSGALDRTYIIEDTADLGNPIITVSTPSFNYLPSPNFRDSYDTILNTSNFGLLNLSGPTQLRSKYVIDNPTAFQNSSLYQNSDTAYTYTTLDNYFAYDDGVPEMRAFLQGVGTQLAVEFNTTVDDTLRGIYFHLPYYINRNAQQDFINVKVWLNNLNNEVYSKDILRLRYVGGFGGYYYVPLTDFDGIATPLSISANSTFYVGWQQSSTTPVPVGIDRSVDRDDKTYVKVGGNPWTNADINCAVMIRPLLSNDPNPAIIGTEQVQNQKIKLNLFPNPSQGIINLLCDECSQLNEYSISIYNSLGQEVYQSKTFVNQIDLTELTKGIYFLSMYKEGKSISNQKFILK